MAHWYDADGAPLPLGALWNAADQTYNFALYSRHATGVTLLLFDAANAAVPSRQFTFDYEFWHKGWDRNRTHQGVQKIKSNGAVTLGSIERSVLPSVTNASSE